MKKDLIREYKCEKCNFTTFTTNQESECKKCKVCGNNMQLIDKYYHNPNNGVKAISRLESYKAYNKQVQSSAQSKCEPKCPTCGSLNVRKIGTLSRMASVGFFGLGSSKLGKIEECKDCGYKW